MQVNLNSLYRLRIDQSRTLHIPPLIDDRMVEEAAPGRDTKVVSDRVRQSSTC